MIASQLGVIHFKRELLPARIHAALSAGQSVPQYLQDQGAAGTREQRRQNHRNSRNRRIALSLWESRLPDKLKVQAILVLTSSWHDFNPLVVGKKIAKRILGPKITEFLKKKIKPIEKVY